MNGRAGSSRALQSIGSPPLAGCYDPRVAIGPIVFFGTPDFALPALDALVSAGRAPDLVVAQPSRPAGRGRRLREPPVARRARELGLEVEQPDRVGSEEFLARLRGRDPDLAVVVAFGQIFPPELLSIPRRGCLNVHGSLLPRHRGAAPIQAAIRERDRVTGVTTMMMDEGLDTGPILGRGTTELGGRETAGELSARLAHLGAAVLLETLSGLEAGTVVRAPQADDGVSYAPRLTKGDGRIDWRLEPAEVDALIRSVTPWPGAFSYLGGQRVKILAARVGEGGEPMAEPGTVVSWDESGIEVACGNGGLVRIERLQKAGKRPLAAGDFARGERLEPGSRFDSPEP